MDVLIRRGGGDVDGEGCRGREGEGSEDEEAGLKHYTRLPG